MASSTRRSNRTEKPDTARILAQLKDFQRDTVDYVYRRLYQDNDFARRFLVADEVGLGKTLVARGLIARAVDHLWDRTERIDIVYICSNSDIARQNINRLNITGERHFGLSSRITLLPLNLQHLERRRLNFVSFTPGTSFELSSGAGQSLERQLLYWLIHNNHELNFKKATQALAASVNIDRFRRQVQEFPDKRPSPHPQIAANFWERLSSHPSLLPRFDALCEAMPRAHATLAPELRRERRELIAELRRLLAQASLHWLQPDVIILDEFQRFKHLIEVGDEVDEAVQLAQQLFDYQQSHDDPATVARVLLLSATPYKMYTMACEQSHEDHYADFLRTLSFLMPSASEQGKVRQLIQAYREQLIELVGVRTNGESSVKEELETTLRRVMVRTERLACSADRNGMLAEIPCELPALTASDVKQYVQLQQVARELDHADILEYWKSAPYLLNFMDEYELKHEIRSRIEAAADNKGLARVLRNAASTLLSRSDLKRYRKLDPGNVRLRSLYRDTIERGAWRLLWMPPSLPYYAPQGPFADPGLAKFTKRLVFSCWRVVPKAIAAVLSYEAEREMVHSYSKRITNTAEARKRRRALLRFSFSKGRPHGMPVLGLIYPARFLAEQFDPLSLARSAGQETPVSAKVLIQTVADRLRSHLAEELAAATQRPGPSDETWYWAAPMLLDLKHHRPETEAWFSQDDLAHSWNPDAHGVDTDAQRGWRGHIEHAQAFIRGSRSLGPPPDDLVDVLAKLALAGPGVTCLRALSRLMPDEHAKAKQSVQNSAAGMAYAFLSLFNLPEVMTLLRDRRTERRYWQSVLDYCLDGNLQSVLDEYAHVLVELEGLAGSSPHSVCHGVAVAIRKGLLLRTSVVQADIVDPTTSRPRLEPLRLRTRFAMRFGDQASDESSESTRADQVRASFNSPFWPFVLATTAVGQEGLDFHPYCHAVVHWNLPSNPVDLEQREGRVHRYKGHALRKNIAEEFGRLDHSSHADIWSSMFAAAKASHPELNDLYPYWVSLNGGAKIERHIPALPLSRDVHRRERLRRALVLYRMVFGQNRQEDLMQYLMQHLPEADLEAVVSNYRLSLAPPAPAADPRGLPQGT